MNRLASNRVSGGAQRRALSALLVAASLALAGCGGLGEGTLPVSAVIQPFGGLEGAPTTKAYTCLNTALSLFIDFNNGARGDFTSRATFSSSNPAVARVSNRDIAVPEQTNSFYSSGTIVPVSPGTATITAQYLSFTESIDVTVTTPTNFKVTPASGDLAVNSRLDLAVTADLDGIETPVDSAVLWSFVTPNTAVATIDPVAGTVAGVAAGSGLTARARIPGCTLTADAAIAVANLQSLALTREFGANDRLIVGTSERLIATGSLDNGMTQDLSQQVTYTSSDATAVALFGSTLPGFGLAIKAVDTPVQIGASFANPAIAAPAIGILPVADSLSSIAITPATAMVSAGRTSQFRSTGTYASGATQDITRHVTWSSSDTASALVQTTTAFGINSSAGLTSTATTAAGKVVTITAATVNSASQPVTATATLNIQ